MAKTVLVTGASSGIGKATATLLAQSGYVVYGAARRINRLKALSEYGVKPVTLDVTSDDSIVSCVNLITSEAGGIDILINSAGLGSYGALEDVPIAEAKNQLEINLFGAARLIQLALPGMRKKKFGKIVNLSSIGGKVGLPMGCWYHASKFAIEGLSDSLRNEVRQFGVDVIVVEPGGTKTGMMDIGGDDLMRVSGHTEYSKLAAALKRSYENMEKNSSDPLVIAKLIRKSIEAKVPKARYAGGAMAKPMLLLRKMLPDRLFDKMLMAQMK
ncbi:short-subunit dehydrogenase [Arcticibacter tournemirensis]|uniref:SDR family NAD(P)-dependent oxidoreductase n=1 Tax=Arcticibacter tournemirensis TaxID=699437 RepID=A0A5M9GZG6_9SPHI|nr:oxidoreductase [Arcticibacter tournemirensis]KAA8478238.1 SDR family NAD(P)-dependent oxidoreductase [Arcticibacter tournemirensis]TQM50734.1 short-subunit dehydrogenase [Arcticibacter tournemirensis]